MLRPTAREMVTDSMMLSSHPMSTRVPIVAPIASVIVRIAYAVMRRLRVVRSMTTRATARERPIERNVPKAIESWRSKKMKSPMAVQKTLSMAVDAPAVSARKKSVMFVTTFFMTP